MQAIIATILLAVLAASVKAEALTISHPAAGGTYVPTGIYNTRVYWTCLVGSTTWFYWWNNSNAWVLSQALGDSTVTALGSVSGT